MSKIAPEEMQSDDWAGEMGEKWNTHLDQFESMIEPVGNALLTFADIEAGDTVIDIGCGGAATSFQIAAAVGPDGHVTGLDLSPVLIETAKSKSKNLKFDNIDFIHGDAASIRLDRTYDRLFSRFGVMFFKDPYAAFAHMRDFLKPAGRVAFSCWGPPPANPWVFELMDIARKYVEVPQADPKAPGPFAFSDTDYVTDIMSKAGFTDIKFKAWEGNQYLGGRGATAEIASRFLMDALFVGEALKAESEAVRASAYDDLVELLQDRESEKGVALKAHAWLVSAKP